MNECNPIKDNTPLSLLFPGNMALGALQTELNRRGVTAKECLIAIGKIRFPEIEDYDVLLKIYKENSHKLVNWIVEFNNKLSLNETRNLL